MPPITRSRVTVTTALVLACLGAAGPAAAATIDLPTPDAARLTATDLLKQLGVRPDRLLRSSVPGPVVNTERVLVGLAGDGGVSTVQLEQRLRLTGQGDYAVRERGPARSAVSLSSEPPPVTRLGAVVWQGFSPGRRDLAARLTLDPAIEGAHLPLSVAVVFTPTGGRPVTLLPGGRLPGAGTVTVTVTDTTAQPTPLPTGSDAPAAALAGPLDRARSVSRITAGRLPSTDAGLPRQVAVTAAARTQGSVVVPLRVLGTLSLTGTTGQVSGPGTTPTATGATLAGTLAGAVTFTAKVDGAGTLALDLEATPTLDPRTLQPPRGLPSWAAWARSRPPQTERRAALDLLVQVAATGARAASYSPYLGADLAGTGSTVFHLSFAPAPRQAAVTTRLHPRPGAIALAGIALLLVLTGSAAVWRQS